MDTVDEQKDQAQPQDGAATDHTDEQGRIWIPKDRFDEVSRQAQAYSKYGKAEEVEAKLKRLDALERASAQDRTTGTQDKEAAALREELFKLVPELADLGELRSMRQEQAAVFRRQASTRIEGYLKEVGLPVTEDNNLDIQDLFVGRINASPAFKARYRAGDIALIDELWKTVRASLFDPFKRSAQANKQRATEQLKLRVGGTPKPSEPKAPPSANDLLQQAGEDAWARLQEQVG